MTSSELRQSFLDFFREKGHTIVPSASLMPGSPNLLFTNAGMNQFVPIFLGEAAADVDKWPGAIPGKPTRATDTQKCIRAGGKHNDLDDVGLDTYHHTFFEMLGNWSFGDYFKTEAIAWAWELVVGRWKFPPQRLYATVYNPDKSLGDPADFDFEAYDIWAKLFESVGLDPKVHIVNGNKKDNFWMMGETGPCGPCSELHVDLTPAGDTRGKLVNMGTAECIEIWNLVFIQFNANQDGTFSPLPAKHVDTGMGFERVASIIQGTKNFSDFANAKISNYETDIFRPIFDELEKMSGHRYGCTLPASGSTGDTEEEKIDVAFRVIADHIRTLSFAIADGIQPGNTDRNYVLRRILRRAVKYGRTLGFHKPFFYQLVDVLARTMGDVFPEIRVKQKHVAEVLKYEEEAFNRTLDKGIERFYSLLALTIDAQLSLLGRKERWNIDYKNLSAGQVGPENLPLFKVDLETDFLPVLKEHGLTTPIYPGGAAIARHHTVTHLLHLALHAVVNPEATQKGSFVGPDKLTFDFNSPALTPQQVRDVERLVNEKIVENAPVSWTEVPYSDIRNNAGIMQFFGEKYGDVVRVVQIGGERNTLNGYSMELCGGTHVRATGEIGLFRIVSESAIAAGVRRIEAVAGLEAYNLARTASDRIADLATKLNAPVGELEKKLDALLTEQKELQKQLKATQQRQAADTAQTLIAKAETLKGTPAIIANLGAVDGDTLQAVADALKGKFSGVAVLAGAMEGSVALAASVAPEFVKAFQAGKIIQAIAPIVGGKGGGRPDFARGAGKDASQLEAALAKARGMLES